MPHNLGLSELQRRCAEAAVKVFRIKPQLTGSQWTERYFHLPRIGRWRWQSAPYMRGIQDSFCDPNVRRIVVMKGSQIGGTMGGIVPALGYMVHQRPTRVLVYFPTESDAKKFSKDKLSGAFDATPELRGALEDSGDSITLEKVFPGGRLWIQSGKTPRTYRQTDAEVAILDDLDGFDSDIGEEGDAVTLADERTKSYRRRKLAAISTPTVEGQSRIAQMYEESDMRRFHVPCPHCNTRQVLKWGGPNKDYGFKWDSVEVDGESEPVIESVAYMCESCHALIEEKHKAWMVRTAATEYEDHGWIAETPERSNWGHGYHLPQFVSLFPGAGWGEILQAWHSANAKRDREALQTVVNQIFAETWEDRGQKADTTELEGRAETWVSPDGRRIDVPHGVGLLCAGVDVQEDRFEILVKGYGEDWESWDIYHERIWGDVQQEDTKARLRAALARRFTHASGAKLPIIATMIDAGYESTMMYKFARPLEAANVWVAQGDKGAPGTEVLRRSARKNKSGVKLWTIGTFKSKRDLQRRLQVQRPGPRHIHFRAYDESYCNGFDAEYFKQFEALSMTYKNRVPVFVDARTRDEAPDLQRLADSAFRGLGPTIQDKISDWVVAASSGRYGPTRKKRRKRGVRHEGVAA